jgi:sulfur carrier protein
MVVGTASRGGGPGTTHSESTAYLDCPQVAQYALKTTQNGPLRITLNGEPYELDEPITVVDLLLQLSIDPRRVAVEHNLEILKRQLFADTLVHNGDRIEIVNFVGGG